MKKKIVFGLIGFIIAVVLNFSVQAGKFVPAGWDNENGTANCKEGPIRCYEWIED